MPFAQLYIYVAALGICGLFLTAANNIRHDVERYSSTDILNMSLTTSVERP
jgi:hypothetical protein